LVFEEVVKFVDRLVAEVGIEEKPGVELAGNTLVLEFRKFIPPTRARYVEEKVREFLGRLGKNYDVAVMVGGIRIGVCYSCGGCPLLPLCGKSKR